MHLLRSYFAVVLAGLSLSACVTGDSAEFVEPAVGTARNVESLLALPAPSRGDKLRYSRGSSLKVVGVHGDVIDWRRGRSTRITAPRNPFLGYTRFENSKVVINVAMDAPVDMLFPLAVGKNASYTSKHHVTYKADSRERSFRRQWNCAVETKERVNVKAGTFDAFKVRCESPAEDALFRISRAYDWHYAPAIGQIVKERYERFRHAPRTKELISVTSSQPLARGQVFEAAWQSAFETQASAVPVSWSDPQNGQSGEIEIRRTFKLKNGTYCRDAEIRLATLASPIGQNLQACREQNGLWVPRLP